jgi:peptide/nickel transport system permease protein
MIAYVIRRILLVIPILFGVTLVVFVILHSMPGDPAQVIAGLDSSKEVLDRIRKDLGLDRPLPVQYLSLMESIFIRGNLGYSYRTRQPVSVEIKRRYVNTGVLAASAIVVAVLIGVPCGIICAVRHNWMDRFLAIVSLIGLSTPAFWSGLLLIILFSVYLGWLPAGGKSGFRSLVLPAITLAIPAAGVIARMVRTSLLEVLRENYIRTAKAKGLPQIQVVLKHGLRNALIPTITVIGLQVGYLLGGSVVVETVFSWPGLGQLIITGILSRDYPMVQGAILVMALAFILINLLVDLLYTYLDPRIQYE